MRHRARLAKLAQRIERTRTYTPEELAEFARMLVEDEVHEPIPFGVIRQIMLEEEEDDEDEREVRMVKAR